MSNQDAFYEVGYADALDGKPMNSSLAHYAAYRDGYHVGSEQRD